MNLLTVFSELTVDPHDDAPSPVCLETPLIVLLTSCPLMSLSYPSTLSKFFLRPSAITRTLEVEAEWERSSFRKKGSYLALSIKYVSFLTGKCGVTESVLSSHEECSAMRFLSS